MVEMDDRILGRVEPQDKAEIILPENEIYI